MQIKIFQEEPLEARAGDRDFLAIMGKEKIVFEEFRRRQIVHSPVRSKLDSFLILLHQSYAGGGVDGFSSPTNRRLCTLRANDRGFSATGTVGSCNL